MELKFRFFSTVINEYDECWDNLDDWNAPTINEFFERTKNHGVIAEQYIGIKDVNGVEIYDGDIVTIKTFKEDNKEDYVECAGVVRTYHNTLGFYIHSFGDGSVYYVLNKESSLEVTGNIHER